VILSDKIMAALDLFILTLPLLYFYREMFAHYKCYTRPTVEHCKITFRHVQEHFSIGAALFIILIAECIDCYQHPSMIGLAKSVLLAVLTYAITLHFRDEREGDI